MLKLLFVYLLTFRVFESVFVDKCNEICQNCPEIREDPNKASATLNCLNELIANTTEFVNITRELQQEIKKLVANQSIIHADIESFINSTEGLIKLVKIKTWNITFNRAFSEAIGSAANELLDEPYYNAWNGMTDEKRIENSARLMAIFQDILLILSAGSKINSKNQISFEHFKGYVHLASPFMQSSPIMINRAMRINSEPETESENIELMSGSRMQLPTPEILGSVLPFENFPPITSRIQMDSAFKIETVKIGYFAFSKLGRLMTKQNCVHCINSDIVGAFVNSPSISVQLDDTPPANFTFKHLRTDGVSNPECVFWNVNNRIWSDKGCKLINTNKTHTICSCTHLTSFAILMDFTNSSSNRVLDTLTKIGCSISIISLLICVFIFSFFRSLYNTRTTIHRNLCISLLISQALFLFGIDRTEFCSICTLIAIGLHYWFTASFAWMLLEGYQLYLMLIKVFEANRTRMLYYYAIGYLAPALIVLITYALKSNDYGTDKYCWINVETSTLWAFIGPISVIILFNSGVLIIALYKVLSLQNRGSLAEKVLGWLKGSAFLLCLLGITWAFGFLSAIEFARPLSTIIFVVLNCLQGTFILIFNVILVEKTRQIMQKSLRKWLRCSNTMSESSNTSLKRNRILKWWSLKSSKESNSSNSNKKEDIQFQPIPLKYEEDQKIARNQVFDSAPLSQANVIVERF